METNPSNKLSSYEVSITYQATKDISECSRRGHPSNDLTPQHQKEANITMSSQPKNIISILCKATQFLRKLIKLTFPKENFNIKLEAVAMNVDTKSLLHMAEKGRNRRNQLPLSIFMVPRIYRDQNPNCFYPKVISIGPLHMGHNNVQEHEWLKGAYMHDLLARLASPPQQTLERCLSKVNSSINEIKLCYGEIYKWPDSYVAKMMVTDACFILEFIQKISEKNHLLLPGNSFTKYSILTDLLLIENQIPFFVLKDIFDLTLTEIQQNHSLITLLLEHVLCVFDTFGVKQKMVVNGSDRYNFKHILEILHKSFQPNDLLPIEGPPNPIVSHSVVELDRAGVKFKPNQGGNLEMTMEYESFRWLWIFWSFSKPTLRMPVLTVQDKTELVLRNLIAYEQCYPNVDGHYFTSLTATMNMLIDSTEDVAKLVESKIIVNYFGSNENAACMINNICSEVDYTKFMFEQQFLKLDNYYKSYWPKNMAWLKRTYFNNPWNVIALVAGILLIALTAIQTIFTVMAA